MLFGIIDADKKEFTARDFPSLTDAQVAAGLSSDVDHGGIVRGVGIVVASYGLYQPVEETNYFHIGRQLFAGNAVLYCYDEAGETIDLKILDLVEKGIGISFVGPRLAQTYADEDLIDRPTISVNGAVVWSWPSPKTNAEFDAMLRGILG